MAGMAESVGVLDDEQGAAEARAALVDKLIADGMITTPVVEAAFRAVPRHLFAPEVSLEAAYADHIVRTKQDKQGVTLSSVSAPWLQARMLESARVGPGMRCLEIGSGGYNAALMAELVGPAGDVTTVDIDPDVTDRARRCLAAAGYDQVRVVLADAEDGLPTSARYDVILVTAQAWDVPPAWTDQLVEGGRLVVPLRLRGLNRTVTFESRGDWLESTSVLYSGFVSMRGIGAHDKPTLALDGERITLVFDDDLPDSPDQLAGVLGTPRVDVDTGVIFPNRVSFETLQLWLATAFDGYCHLAVDKEKTPGLIPPPVGMGHAAVDGASLAYLGGDKIDDDWFRFGVHGFGPEAATLAEAFAAQVRHWNHVHRDGPGPRVTLHPRNTPDSELPGGRVIDRRHSRIVLLWP
nr:methyltransferase, FxLD system [Pseudofrankia sp. BMG5.36]